MHMFLITDFSILNCLFSRSILFVQFYKKAFMTCIIVGWNVYIFGANKIYFLVSMRFKTLSYYLDALLGEIGK